MALEVLIFGLVGFGLLAFIPALVALLAANRRSVEDRRPPSTSRRRVALVVCGIVAGVLVIGLIAARPSAVAGVDGEALESSVGNGGLPGFGLESCREIDGDTWSCSRWDNQMSGSIPYLVHINGLGCWKALRQGPAGEGSDKRLSGCVNVLDYLFG